jgi:phosphoribosyl isomerase A
MSFQLLPAMDIAEGRVVGVSGGNTATVSELARRWREAGATWIHLVDLDAAFGRGSNAALLEDVIANSGLRVELSAGVVDDAGLAWAESTGADRIIIPSRALTDLDWCAKAIETLGDRAAVALDGAIETGRNGEVAYRLSPRGMPVNSEPRGVELWGLLSTLNQMGCRRYVMTDVSRDGNLAGPNFDLYEAVMSRSTAAVLASGGVSSLADVRALAAFTVGGRHLDGVIVGRALHTGQFTLSDALAAIADSGPSGV